MAEEAGDQNVVAMRAAASAAGRYAVAGYTTVFDGVVIPRSLPDFVAAASAGPIDYVILLPTLEVCIERVAMRADHGFTDERATRKMHEQFDSGEVDQRHMLRNPPKNAEEVVDLILNARAREALAYTS